MLNNLNILTNCNLLKNKYFLVLCFYLKKNNNNNYILNYLFFVYNISISPLFKMISLIKFNIFFNILIKIFIFKNK